MKNIIGLIITLIVLIGACFEVSKAVNMPLLFIDLPSLIIVLLIGGVYSYSKGKNKLVEFGNGAVYAGWLGFLIGLIGMSIQFASSNINIEGLMRANSVLWLCVFYGYSVRLIINIAKN